MTMATTAEGPPIAASACRPQVLGAPALANTSNYTVNTAGAEEEEEQYFITVPQDLDSSTGE